MLPNGKLIELPSCGHFPDLEAPEAFFEAINEVASQ
jgi:pimeloyl-ACP methyl ester carboxylesterase